MDNTACLICGKHAECVRVSGVCSSKCRDEDRRREAAYDRWNEEQQRKHEEMLDANEEARHIGYTDEF